MTTRETNEIRELSGSDLDLVSGGSITEGVRTAVSWANAVATIVYAGAYMLTASAEYHPDPWG
jgi:hypothetical protein